MLDIKRNIKYEPVHHGNGTVTWTVADYEDTVIEQTPIRNNMAFQTPTSFALPNTTQYQSAEDVRKLAEEHAFWREQHSANTTFRYLGGPGDKMVYLYMPDTQAHVPIPISRLIPGMLFRVSQHAADDLMLCLNPAHRDDKGQFQMNAVPISSGSGQSTINYQVGTAATTSVSNANLVINPVNHTSTMIDIERQASRTIDPETCVDKNGNGTQVALYQWYAGTHMHLHILIMCIFAAYRDALSEGFDEEDVKVRRDIIQRHIANVEYPETLNVDKVSIVAQDDVMVDITYADEPRRYQQTRLTLFPSRVSVSTKETLPYGAGVNLGGVNGVPCIIQASTIMEDLSSDTWRYGKDE